MNIGSLQPKRGLAPHLYNSPFVDATPQWTVSVVLCRFDGNQSDIGNRRAMRSEAWNGTSRVVVSPSYPAGRAGRFLGWVFGIGLLCLLALVLHSVAHAQSGSDTATIRSPFVTVGRLVQPSVVNIRTVRSVTRGGVDLNPLQEMFRRFFPGGERGETERFDLPSTGSGFVVKEDGHILTNHHVIAQADAVFVRFTGEQREYPAEVVGNDPNTDLAVLKIDPDHTLWPLPFGDSDAIEVGDWAIAIGNPFGNLEGSLTVGVVSAKGRSDLVIHGGSPRYQDFIQTDASINFGNSGGPLVDITGKVIGVNTAVNTGGQGISFAIPSKLASRILEELLAHGRVVRGYLGIRTAAVDDSDGEEISGSLQGARILAVVPGSPADEAGLRAGDVIVVYGGQDVHSQQHLQFLVAESEVGQEITCEAMRDDQRMIFSVVPVEFQEEQGASRTPAASGWLGMEVASLDGSDPRVVRLKEALGVTATTGVMVVTVETDSPAAEAGIRPGDVLVSIDGEEMLGLSSYRRVRDQLSGRMESIEILIRTGSAENYVLVRPRAEGLEQ